MGAPECLPDLITLEVQDNSELGGTICSELVAKQGHRVHIANTRINNFYAPPKRELARAAVRRRGSADAGTYPLQSDGAPPLEGLEG